MTEKTPLNSQVTDSAAPETAAALPRGRFVWHDLMTGDVEKAKQYYADLLGWTYIDADMGSMGLYSMIHAGGTEWGGFMPLDPAHGIPPHWISYVDVAAATAQAEALGGTTGVPATPIPTVGTFAVITSPSGAWVSPYTPESPQGDPKTGPAPGIFCWHELLSQDPAGDARFFCEIFGWRTEEMPMGEMGTYTLFKRLDTGTDAGGMLAKPPGDPGPSSWLPYVLVETADATAARVGELGGKVWVPPTDIPGVGRFTVTSDPQGAFLAYLQPSS